MASVKISPMLAFLNKSLRNQCVTIQAEQALEGSFRFSPYSAKPNIELHLVYESLAFLIKLSLGNEAIIKKSLQLP